MVTNRQILAHCLNLFSKKHYLVQPLAKLWASTTNIKGKGLLQTFRQSQNEGKFQHNLPHFSLNITLRILYCNFKCPDMLCSSIVIQITYNQLFTTS